MNTPSTPRRGSPLHTSVLHESGYRHTTGEARYVDDLPTPANACTAAVLLSPHAHARILSRDATKARQLPGVLAVLFAEDVPGHLLVGPIVHDEPLLADEEVHHVGQAVALVVATSPEAARAALPHIEVIYDHLPALTTLRDAIDARSFHTDPHVIARGEVAQALANAAVVISAELASGSQEHFYLETHCALALPGEDHTLHVHSSTQHPTEIQKMVASVLGIGAHKVVCEVPRMGGGFGGKESQATQIACMAALGAWHTGRPVKLRLDREHDMRLTGRRHPFWTRYQAGFDEAGRLIALQAELFSDGGWTLDLSPAILDRALFHLDNCYFIEHCHFSGRVARTNLPSNTAFRGFGGPQGMLVVEDAFSRYAERTGRDPAAARIASYYGPAPRNRAPYGQEISDCRIERITAELLGSSDYQARREAIEAHNRNSPVFVRGIGFHPLKFGISFTKSILNQGGALVHVYTDGTVQVNHGGTEMGQGLHTKMQVIAAHELGAPLDAVRLMNTATDKVPNTSATAASSGTDLNGQAVREACTTLRERMRPVAAGLLGVNAEQAHRLRFEAGLVFDPADPDRAISLAKVATQAWLERISLSATGFYRTPGIWYDHQQGRGEPFYYFAYGAAVTELEVCRLTGEHRLLRVDILHDVGTSLTPDIDRGQVEGAYVQGLGWLTMEEILHAPDGRLITSGPSTYKIPAIGDVPTDLRVALLERAPQPQVVHGSKAVGEPPFMLAISAWTALRHAIGSVGPAGREVELAVPATPEAILRALTR
jgi:xanthine dehydrogenase large subunit